MIAPKHDIITKEPYCMVNIELKVTSFHITMAIVEMFNLGQALTKGNIIRRIQVRMESNLNHYTPGTKGYAAPMEPRTAATIHSQILLAIEEGKRIFPEYYKEWSLIPLEDDNGNTLCLRLSHEYDPLPNPHPSYSLYFDGKPIGKFIYSHFDRSYNHHIRQVSDYWDVIQTVEKYLNSGV